MRFIGSLFLLLLAFGVTACDEKKTLTFPELLTSAQAGDSDAQYSLALAYQEGHGTAMDIDQAIVWYKKAAAGNEPNALYTLGHMRHRGIGMKRDFVAAAKWYRAAGDNGHPKAMFNLARLYMSGLGVERSFSEGVAWIEKAANQGMFEAQWRLGEIYKSGGIGVEGDIEKAKMWYARAEKSGDLNSDYDPDYRYTP